MQKITTYFHLFVYYCILLSFFYYQGIVQYDKLNQLQHCIFSFSYWILYLKKNYPIIAVKIAFYIDGVAIIG